MKLTASLILSSLKTRPLRMFLSTFGIVLGVAAILGINITNQTAMESVTKLFKDTSGKANLVVRSADIESRGFDARIVSRLEALPAVHAALPSVQVQTQLVDESSPSEIGMNFFGTSAGGLTIYGIDPTRDRMARVYEMLEGTFLSPQNDASEIVLVESFAEDNDLAVGDSIEIITEAGEENLQIVGLMSKDGPGQLNNGAFGITPIETVQKLFYREGKINQIDLVVQPEYNVGDPLEDLRVNLEQALGSDYSVLYPASQGRRMTQMLGSYQIGLNFLSGMALFVGAFLIFNSFSMTVVERTREFGMLRTVGMTRGQVTIQVLSEAIVLGIFGTAIGLGFGVLMARGLTLVMEQMLSLELSEIPVPVEVVLTGLVVGLIVAIVSAFIPAWRAGRISPLEALRVRTRGDDSWMIRRGWSLGLILFVTSISVLVINPFPNDEQFRVGSMAVFTLFFGGTLLIPSSVSIWEILFRPVMRLIYGNSGRLGSSNIQRAKSRTSLTVAALMIGVAMIIVVWVMTDSFKGDLDEWLDGYIGGDLFVTSSLPMGKDVWKKLESVPGVSDVTPVRYFEVEWYPPAGGEERITFRAFDPASYTRVTSFIFNQDEPEPAQSIRDVSLGDNILISSVISEKYDLSTGDRVEMLTRVGPRSFNVAGIVVDYYNQGLVINGSWLDMQRYFRQRDANVFLIKVQQGVDKALIRDRIDDQYGDRERLIVETNQDILGRVSILMEQAFSMFDVTALIAMLVGFFGIVNTLTMNVMERTQEIGMLRGVGMTRGQVVRMILAEAALIGIIGGLLGLAFGVILSRVFMLAMTAMSGYTLEYLLPVQRVITAVIIAIIVSQLAASLPAIRAARIQILEAIHYE